MRISIAQRFIFGFILIVSAVVGVEYGISSLDMPQWSKGVVPTFVAMIVGLVLGFALSRALSSKVGRLVTATERMARGDLREPVSLGTKGATDEFDDLAGTFNQLHGNLVEMVGHIVAAANDLAVSTQTLSASAQEMKVSGEEISATMDDVARGVESQKGSVEEMAKLIHDQGRGLEDISRASEEAAANALMARVKSQSGGATAQRTFEDLREALTSLEDSAKVFVAFSERIHQIHKFAEVITNMSRQTNLLALNAAIEATKAGEAGKGFAVVAEEIRRLADAAEKSADQIGAMLDRLSDESRRVRALVEDSVKRVADGRERLQGAGAVLYEIAALVQQNADSIGKVPTLVQTQVEASRTVARLVDRIEEVAESNATAAMEVTATVQHQAAAMEEMAQSAYGLSKIAKELNNRVAKFNIKDSDIPG